MTELATERLILRPFRDEDAEDVYRYASDPEVGPPAGWLPHKSVKESLEAIRTVLSMAETYAVCLKETGEVIGSIGLFPHRDEVYRGDDGLKLPEAGYWIGKPFWGRGLIPEALREMMRHAFEDLGAECMFCGYYEGNGKSERVQEKCGFTYHHSTGEIYFPLFREFRTEHFTYISREMWESGRSCVPADPS